MIYAFIEDGGVDVHGNLEEVRREHEAIDVENEDVVFYDDEGKRLVARFTRPNVKNRLFRLISFLEQGEFELYPALDRPTDIRARLSRAVCLQPNGFYGSLDEIRARFKATSGG